MYSTRSSKKLNSVATLNSKTGKTTTLSENSKAKQIFFISGRAVLKSKNKSNNKSLSKSEKNIQLSSDKHKDLGKNENGIQTVINKENIINPKVLRIFESNYKAKHIQVRTQQEKEQTVISKKSVSKKSNFNTNKEKINTVSLIPKLSKIKSKYNKNRSTCVAEENRDTTKNKFDKSLNLNKKIPKHIPVWKMCPNDSEKSKKRTMDVYDITEDEDLKKEGFHKKKKISKQNKPKVKKIHVKAKKNNIKESHQGNPDTKALSDKDQEKLKNNTRPLTCSNVNNALDRIVLQKHEKKVMNGTNVIKTLEEVTIIGVDKQAHKEATQVRETEPSSKQTLDNATIVDPAKQIRREVTPVRETQPDSKQVPSVLNNQGFDTHERVLIPQMTSTPETDVCPTVTTYITLGNSFVSRMSEIPAIPVITRNLEVDCLDDELLYSDKPTCSPVKISLFESPIKFDKTIKKPSGTTFKQRKLNAVCEPSTQTTEHVTERNRITEKDSITDSWNLFISPAEKRDNLKSDKKLETFSRVGKGKKPRKSYNNRDKIRVNIADWKKASNKEKSAAEKKEEELVKSLNEHFSDLESFELCID